MALHLEIITPEGKAYSQTADSVIIPTPQGEIDILPGHIPLLTLVAPGELRAEHGETSEFLAVDEGFAQILGDKVSIMTEQAINVEEIDLTVIEEARARAEKALKEAIEKGEDPAVVEEAETILRFAIAQRLAKERRR